VSAARGTGWGVAIVAVVSSIALTAGPSVAGAGPSLPAGIGPIHAAVSRHGPNAKSLTTSQQTVARDEREVRRISTAVVAAHAHLATLRVRAEEAFESYDGARVNLAAARRSVESAHNVLAGADAEVNQGQARMNRFVTLSYESGSLESITAYLSPGGPAELESRVGALNAIDSSEQREVDALQAARIYQGVVSRQAEAVAVRASGAATVAQRAKSAAQAAVSRQRAVVAGIRRRQTALRDLLARDQAHAAALERARQAAIAAARAAAARARRAAGQGARGPSPYAGLTGNLAGTASATTEAAALQAAEAEIGKPYVWAAAGPNSFDCSGLTMRAWGAAGVSLPHYTNAQYAATNHVSRSDMQPGDLIFFHSDLHHVGIYIGGGMFVHAQNSATGVVVSPIAGWWSGSIAGIGRP
jgi:peptidoglycan DL-endopeptidase CwlO